MNNMRSSRRWVRPPVEVLTAERGDSLSRATTESGYIATTTSGEGFQVSATGHLEAWLLAEQRVQYFWRTRSELANIERHDPGDELPPFLDHI